MGPSLVTSPWELYLVNFIDAIREGGKRKLEILQLQLQVRTCYNILNSHFLALCLVSNQMEH